MYKIFICIVMIYACHELFNGILSVQEYGVKYLIHKIFHYVNIPIQYSAMCHDVRHCIFSKEKDNIFRVFDLGMDHWDSLGRLSEAFPMSTEGLCVDNLRKQ